LFCQAESYGVEAIEYEQAATDAFEMGIRSQELREVINRYTNSSIFSKRTNETFVKVQRLGVPIPNIQVQAMTAFNETIYATTDANGIAKLSYVKGEYLKKIIVVNFPLIGNRFDNGQTVVVEMDFLTGGTHQGLQSA
jgi:hypothetical protein